MLKILNTTKMTIAVALIAVGILCSAGLAKADSPVGDVVQFAPASNWYAWVIRYLNETGRGQTFITPVGTTGISTVAMKLCRTATLTKPKTLTLCTTATTGYYAGCQTPLASRTFSASELNTLINYDANCYGSNEGGANDGAYYKWAYFSFNTPVAVSGNTSYFFLLNSASSADNESGNPLPVLYNNCNYLGSSANYTSGQTYNYHGSTRYAESDGALCDTLFKVFSANPIVIPFAITSPQNNDPEVADTWITVTGTCPTNGVNRIGFTNDCLGFDKINYNVSCTSNTFSGQFYYNGLGDKRVIAREASSTSGDCVDYDNKMDFKTVRTIEIINGYPDNWYFNFDYYNDYDIKIKSPKFDTALTLPIGSTSSLFTFQFIYPASSTLANLNFIIKQYKPDGTLLNGSYHTKLLSQMANTQSYAINLDASSTTPLHYVVQLTESGEMKRQYPFAIYVSDIDYTFNTTDNQYFFPRLVDLLKTKIIFNYYFAFHDGFYNLFNASSTATTDTALDITFKSVSADKQYNTDIKIFSASDPNVKNFANGLRPYIVAFLWLIFALYLILRVSYLFSGNNQE